MAFKQPDAYMYFAPLRFGQDEEKCTKRCKSQSSDNHFKPFYDATVGSIARMLGPQDD